MIVDHTADRPARGGFQDCCPEWEGLSQHGVEKRMFLLTLTTLGSILSKRPIAELPIRALFLKQDLIQLAQGVCTPCLSCRLQPTVCAQISMSFITTEDNVCYTRLAGVNVKIGA